MCQPEMKSALFSHYGQIVSEVCLISGRAVLRAMQITGVFLFMCLSEPALSEDIPETTDEEALSQAADHARRLNRDWTIKTRHKYKLRVGETDMSQALRAGDIEAFRSALRKGLEGPAEDFLKDWRTVTETGDTLFHLMGKAPKNQREFARDLSEIIEVLSFPKKAKAKGHREYKVQGLRIFKPLEKIPLSGTLIRRDIEAFTREIDRLLSGPTEDLLGALHVITWTRQTLYGMIDQHIRVPLMKERAEKHRITREDIRITTLSYTDKITLLASLFTGPLKWTNREGFLPAQSAKKAKNREIHAVLSQVTTDKTETDGKYILTALGVSVVWGLEAIFLFTPENRTLENMADTLGISNLSLANFLFYGPPALSITGLICHSAFKAAKQKNILKNLSNTSSNEGAPSI